MTGKTCVIVGAGDGLGLGIARKFGRSGGLRIALISRNPDKLAKLVAALASDGIEARAFPADVHDQPALQRALDSIGRDYGPIEVLSYSPEPHTPPKDLHAWMPLTMTLEEVQKRMSLACYGAVVCAQSVVPGMIERGSGTFLVTTANSGIEPVQTLCAVAVSMAAVRNYVFSLHQHLEGKNVYAASVVLKLLIEKGSEYGDPDKLAEAYWDLHVKREVREVVLTQPGDVLSIHREDMVKYGIEMPKELAMK